MGRTKFQTLSDVICEHQAYAAAGDAILEQQVGNDRLMRESYDLIRDALSRDEMKGFALIDDATERAYFMVNGLVSYLPYRWSTDLKAEVDQEAALSLGEVS